MQTNIETNFSKIKEVKEMEGTGRKGKGRGEDAHVTR